MRPCSRIYYSNVS